MLVRLGEARNPREIAIRPALIQTLVGLGVAMFGPVMATMAAFGLYDISFVGPAPAWRAAGLAIEAGVVEELIVRGVVLRLLWRGFGPLPAFLLSAALFGTGHLPNSASSVFAAICIAVEARRRGTFKAPRSNQQPPQRARCGGFERTTIAKLVR